MQTISAIRNVRRKSQPSARCANHLNGQNEISTRSAGADGFLNHSFIPLCLKGTELLLQEAAEAEFFRSAENLCKVHGFQQVDRAGLPYPHNILLTHRDMETKLNRQPYGTELYITRDWFDKHITLATKQVYEVGNTLYYIPVIPLYHFLRIKDNKKCGELLLGVMSYLYREAGVPYYREEGSFMFGEYEMNKEYFLECREESPEDFEEDLSDILRNELCGDIMQRKIHNPYHLKHFAETIAAFKPKTTMEEDCLLVAQDALRLYLEFPKNNVFQHVVLPEEEEYDDETANPESYVSFIGDGKGWVYENIERNVNDFLGNYAEMALPCRVQVYDGTAVETQTLEFEYRLFELVDDLCQILFGMP